LAALGSKPVKKNWQLLLIQNVVMPRIWQPTNQTLYLLNRQKRGTLVIIYETVPILIELIKNTLKKSCHGWTEPL
jgi:hypothetical protein